MEVEIPPKISGIYPFERFYMEMKMKLKLFFNEFVTCPMMTE